MRLLRIIGAMLTLWALFVPRSFGDPITFTHQGIGNAAINEHPVFDAAFTITAVGDTINRRSSEVGFFIEHTSASISITGLGTFTFITPTRTFVNNGNEVVGFPRAGVSGSDLFTPEQPVVFNLGHAVIDRTSER